ncbi:phosphatidate cytidylyltransferase [Streptomyces sp. NPDC015131]|uniref:phosphatidate cytidylyltransferase n=1 Tax=Streptomyces sp. NPDC015131 TaxID=3364941 RepID=UPI0036F94CAC
MNDSSWGAPPRGGQWGPPDQGYHPGFAPAAPAGPAYDGHEAQQTRPMPIVPDVPAGGDSGGDQDDRDRGTAPQSGPPFRDETPRRPGFRQPHRPDGGAQEPLPGAQPEAPRPGPPGPGAPQPPEWSGAEQPPQRPGAERPGAEQPGAEQPGARGRQKKRAGRDLRAAIGVGVGLGAVIVASLFVVKAVFVGVIAVAVVVGLWELTSRLQERKGIRAPLVPLAVGGAAMVVAGYVRGAEGAWVAMALTALAVLVWRMTEPPENYLRDVTAGVFAAFYVPFLATFVAMMLTADDGPWRVLTFLLLTVVSDTGAYAVGWRFGRTKLAPRISPGKTREGLLGAVAFAMAAGALCMEFAIDGGTWWQGLLLGLAVAASATLGDLGESMIKRDLGIKDMGTLLPGHGGIMDRLDSLLPTAPVVWLLLVVFTGSG